MAVMAKREDLPVPDDFRFHCEVPVRFRDLDAMGHVNNAVYLTFFEVGRERYVEALELDTPPDTPMKDRFPFIILDAHIRFVSPARFGESIRAHVRITDIGTKSFVFRYLLTSTDGGRTLAVGRTTMVHYDYVGQKTTPIPESFLAAIRRLEGIAGH